MADTDLEYGVRQIECTVRKREQRDNIHESKDETDYGVVTEASKRESQNLVTEGM